MVKWFKLRPSGDDVEVSGCCPRVSFRVGSGGLDVGPLGSRPPIPPQLIGEEEDVSVYDIADHPDFRFRTTDIVIRIGNTEDGGPHREDEVRTPWPVWQLQYLMVPPGGTRSRDLQVLWAACPPQAPSPGERLPAVGPLSPSTCTRTHLPAGLRPRSHSCSLGLLEKPIPVLSATSVVSGAIGAQERPGEVASELGPGEQVGTRGGVGQIPGRGRVGTKVPRLEPHPGNVGKPGETRVLQAGRE